MNLDQSLTLDDEGSSIPAEAPGKALIAESTSVGPTTSEREALLAVRNFSEIEKLKTGLFHQSFTLDGAFAGIVIGKQGQTITQIQDDTHTTVTLQGLVPERKKSKEPLTVEIEGPSEDDVSRASSLIQEVVDNAIQGRLLDYSHFVSLPLANHPPLVSLFTRFRDTILQQGDMPRENDTSARGDRGSAGPSATSAHEGRDTSARPAESAPGDETTEESASNSGREGMEGGEYDLLTSSRRGGGGGGGREEQEAQERERRRRLLHEGVDPTIFIKPSQLHLTVQMLKLWSPARVEAARKALESCVPALTQALQGRPLRLRVANLHLMKGNPKRAHVLYAGVSEEDGTQSRLLKACEVMRESMREAGLVTRTDATSPLKLHLTLINSSHRKGKRGRNSFKRVPFDATSILDQFGNLDWGTFEISEAHLSQRFVFDHSGYYHCCGTAEL